MNFFSITPISFRVGIKPRNINIKEVIATTKIKRGEEVGEIEETGGVE